MKFSYTYKTSDGTRHEDRMEAPTREDVFLALRGKGIRPIKVVSLSGSKANGEERLVTRKRFVFAALVAGLAIGVALAVWYGKSDLRDRRIVELEAQAVKIVKTHQGALATLHLEELRDYAAIAQAKAPGFLNQKISLCYHDLDSARSEVRALFREPMSDWFREADKRDELKRIYDETMDALDLVETRFLKDEKAYRLLDENRSRWTYNGTNVVFSDTTLETKFANLTREIESK